MCCILMHCLASVSVLSLCHVSTMGFVSIMCSCCSADSPESVYLFMSMMHVKGGVGAIAHRLRVNDAKFK